MAGTFRYDQRLQKVAYWVQRGTGFSEYDLTVLSDVDPDDAGQTKAVGGLSVVGASRRMRTHNRWFVEHRDERTKAASKD